jgi:uncharacterized protein (DUF1015 family)
MLALIDVSTLKPTEEHCPESVTRLVSKIAAEGHWTTPVLVLDEPRIVLDGHHRLAASKVLNLRSIPAFVVKMDDPSLNLSSWRPELPVTISDVLDVASSGRLFPAKTTRFRLDYSVPTTCIALEELAL